MARRAQRQSHLENAGTLGDNPLRSFGAFFRAAAVGRNASSTTEMRKETLGQTELAMNEAASRLVCLRRPSEASPASNNSLQLIKFRSRIFYDGLHPA